jgi:hypothetical protein
MNTFWREVFVVWASAKHMEEDLPRNCPLPKRKGRNW